MYGKCVSWVVFMAALAGCGKPAATNGEAAAASPPVASAMPANVVLSGQYVDGNGFGLVFAPDGRAAPIGSPGQGRYVGEGQTFRVEIAGMPPAMGHVYSPNKISVTYPNDPRGTQYLFREGSDLAAQARAEATHRPVERKAPDFDRNVPLDKYVDLSPDGTTEGVTYLYVALHEPPLADEERFRLLSPHRSEPDAFKRRDHMQSDLPGIDAKLASMKGQRYFKLHVDTAEWGRLGKPNPENGFAWMQYTGGFDLGSAYDMSKKGFPSLCMANEGKNGVLFGREETYHRQCVLVVDDEATARALEAQRASSSLGVPAKTVDLYFYAVRDLDGGGNQEVSAVLTHARVRFAKERKFDGSEVEPFGPPIDVVFPQPAID